jgi:L-alanine-DL-glutamate epimerase-like enolase superfamily enzyme
MRRRRILDTIPTSWYTARTEVEVRGMRVERFQAHHLSLPLAAARRTGTHFFDTVDYVLLELEAEGLTGLARRQAESIRAMMVDLAEQIVGEDTWRVRGIWQELWTRINFIGQAGPPVMALTAIDTALWDLRAQEARMPLYRMLGAARSEVPVYATGGWLSESSEQLIEEGLAIKERGFAGFKIKVGHPDWRVDVERVRLLREAVGNDLRIMADANQAWSVKDAIRAGRGFEEYEVAWLEEPVSVHDIEGSAEVAARQGIPVAVGETIFTRRGLLPLLEARTSEFLVLHLSRSGGPTEFMRMAALADTYDRSFSTITFTEVCAHLVAACPNGQYVEYLPGWTDNLFEGAPPIVNGCIALSDVPGVGFTFSPDAKRQYGID